MGQSGKVPASGRRWGPWGMRPKQLWVGGWVRETKTESKKRDTILRQKLTHLQRSWHSPHPGSLRDPCLAYTRRFINADRARERRLWTRGDRTAQKGMMVDAESNWEGLSGGWGEGLLE